MNTRAGDVFWLIQQIHRVSNYKDDNETSNKVQNFTNTNTPKRINVTGKRGTGGWI